MCSVTKKIAKQKKYLKFETHTMLARPQKVGTEAIVKVQKKRVVQNNDSTRREARYQLTIAIDHMAMPSQILKLVLFF